MASLVVSSDFVQFKLARAVFGYGAFPEDHVRESRDKIGLRPMDFRFVQIAEQMWTGRSDSEPNSAVQPGTEGRRESDESILTRMRTIFEVNDLSSARKVQQISIVARNSQSEKKHLDEFITSSYGGKGYQ